MHPQIRPYLYSVGYAALIFISVQEPGLLAPSLLQLAICVGVLTLLLFFLKHRNEIQELVQAIFSACANFLLFLLPASYNPRRQTADPTLPTEPFYAVLFQRPPPHLA